MISSKTKTLPTVAVVPNSKKVVEPPTSSAANTVPCKLPTPPNTTPMKASTM